MAQLAAGPYRIIPLDEIGHSPGTLAITFDDGYRNFAADALPVLERLKIPATIFIVAGECGGTNRWDADKAGIPELPLMEWDELRDICGRGVTIGAHTMTHPNLTKLLLADAEREISTAQVQLQDRLRQPVREFAYPYGALTPEVRSIVSNYYQLACGTELGFASDPLDRLLLPRIDAYYLRSRPVFRRFAAGKARGYLAARRLLRGLRS